MTVCCKAFAVAYGNKTGGIGSVERTREEEMEYRRYLHRLKRREERRRKVMIARAIVLTVGVLLLVGLGALLRLGVRMAMGNDKPQKQAKVSASPSPDPLDYSVPEGYEEYASQLEGLLESYPEAEDILRNLYEYPESMLELAVKNQEALDFVLDYPKHKSDIKPSGAVTQEEMENAVNGIPAFLQWDGRWGYLTYGSDNIGINGCGPTCLSMVAAGLLKDTGQSPDAVAEFSVENNYCTPASGTSWSLMSSGAQKLGLTAASVTLEKETIRGELKAGHPVICSMKPGDFTTTGHFIVLVGLTEEGKVIVNDPNSKLRSQEEWKLNTIVTQTKAAWSYSVP